VLLLYCLNLGSSPDIDSATAAVHPMAANHRLPIMQPSAIPDSARIYSPGAGWPDICPDCWHMHLAVDRRGHGVVCASKR
jgi:hypothetical protein